MLLLFETAAGFAVFKVLNEKKLKHAENLYLDFESPESAGQIVKLKQFQKFGDITTALASATATVEGKMSKPLKKLMKKLVSSDAQEELAVADAKLGNIIKEKFDIQCVANSSINELMRCIRSQLDSLIGDKEIEAFSRGLAHSLSRYKLKFSPEKVDTMIVQAISALDDADKELNNYCMRAKEWYSWHFPELGKVVTDHESFVRTVMKIGNKLNAAACDLSDILPEGVEGDVKEAAEISMGTEIAEEDILMILNLCQQIVEMTEHRSQLYEYLKNRMVAIAPNLTTLVGELVGARLVSHAGSLVNLAKHPSSTVQILGAEKALFRALKAKHDTPKYGLIYHASLVGQTTPKNKGKLSRMLAAKSSLAARVDAFGEETNVQMGLDNRAKLEMRIRQLENKGVQQISGTGKRKANDDVYENKSEVRMYNTAADSTLPSVSKKRKLDDTTEAVSEGDASFANDSQSEKKKKKKKIKQEDVKTEPGADGDTSFADVSGMSDGGEKKKKKKKKIKVESDD